MSTGGTTAERLRRLLAILAWLAQEGEAPIDQVAARFDLTAPALVAELEMAACCGVPPYTPDQLMDIVVTDTTVSTRVGTALARPRRLSPPEGFALATSARALLAVSGSDGDGALSRALAKLDRVLGGDELEVELDVPAHLELVREAAATQGRLAISYYSASSDRVTDRQIDPLRVFASEGHWYVDAWCASADEMRRFRVDRINAAELVEPGSVAGSGGGSGGGAGGGSGGGAGGGGGGAAGATAGGGVGAGGRPDAGERDASELRSLTPFVPGPDSRRVRLSLDPSVAWLVEALPATGPPHPVDGRIEIELFVGGDAWLERLLLRLGPDARVVDPAGLQSLTGEAAARILKRYQDAG